MVLTVTALGRASARTNDPAAASTGSSTTGSTTKVSTALTRR